MDDVVEIMAGVVDIFPLPEAYFTTNVIAELVMPSNDAVTSTSPLTCQWLNRYTK